MTTEAGSLVHNQMLTEQLDRIGEKVIAPVVSNEATQA
jgi:hypothetical protein